MKLRYQIVIAAFLMSLIGGVIYAIHHNAYESGKFDSNQAWNLKWAERDGKDLLELAGRQVAERTEEQRRQKEADKVAKDAQTQLDKARLDAANAKSAADKLQLTIANIRHQLAASETSKLSAIASASATRANAGVVLADVLSKSVERNQQLATTADDSRVAGLACERSYDAVTNQSASQ
jgi:cell division protein FtsN